MFNNNYSRNLPYPERIRKQICSIQQTYRSSAFFTQVDWIGLCTRKTSETDWGVEVGQGNSSFKSMNSISQMGFSIFDLVAERWICNKPSYVASPQNLLINLTMSKKELGTSPWQIDIAQWLIT